MSELIPLMEKQFTYLAIDLGAILIPFLFSFHPKLRFDKEWGAFFPACITTGVLFLIWDYVYTDLGVWGFNPDYLTGLYVLNLPIEECLFFFCIPYACVFTYHCFNVLISKDYFASISRYTSVLLIFILLLVGLFSMDKLYTSVTFTLMTIAIIYSEFLKRHYWFSRFYFSYMFLLIPFFLTNGILTGSFLAEPIVWYDNAENLGIRITTIPIEDTIYGMLMIWLNILLFHKFGESYTQKLNSDV